MAIRRHAAGLALVLLATVTPGWVTPASAAPRTPVDIDTRGMNGGGAAEFRGRLVWRSGKVVRVQGALNDLCPADSAWAKLQIRVMSKGRARSYHVFDRRGCDAAGVVSINKAVRAHQGRRITGIRLTIREQGPYSDGPFRSYYYYPPRR